MSILEGHYIKPDFLKHRCLFHTIMARTYLLSKLLLGSVLVKSPELCFCTMRQISKRSWLKIYLLFVYIQVLVSCGLQFPADCLTVISNLYFLSVLFKSFRILTVFTVFILNFVGWMLCHSGLTVTCWTFLCSLRMFWTSLDCAPSATGNTGVQNICRNHWWLWKSCWGPLPLEERVSAHVNIVTLRIHHCLRNLFVIY